jgi:predicted ferric reductase
MLLGIYYLKISFESAFMVLFPKLIPGFATWLGIAALTLLIFLLILTLYIKLPYQIWRFTHKFLGLSLTLATLHIFFITSDVTVNLPLRFYILGMCLIGLACYTYRTLLFRILVKRYEYEVTGIEVVEDITQINLKPIAKPIPEPIPGQFIFASFKSLGITEEIHPFSLTSTPSENQISIAAKSSGDYTETLKLLKKGAVAKIEGPFGRFSYLESRRTKFIWIAGGIGATPFVSMANSLKSNNSYDIYFYYVVSEKKEAVFLAFFEQIARDIPNFNLIPVFTKSEGRITAEKITLKVPDFNSRDIFLCGPPPMMQSLRSQFNSFGMKNRHIFSEEFSLD